MTTVVELEVHASETVLGSVFETVPELTCEMEPVIASAGYGLWVSTPDQAALERALEDDATVRTYSVIGTEVDRTLYELAFADDAVDVFGLFLEEGGTVLSTAANDGCWHVRGRFADREAAGHLYHRLEREGCETTLIRLTELQEGQATAGRLTPKQHETLLTALERGYFTIPRETSMEELAAELDISHQALSERFRRAYRALVMTELNGSQVTQRVNERISA